MLRLLAALSAGSVVAPQLWAQEAEGKRFEGLEEVDLKALKDLAKAYTAFDAQDAPGVERMVERLHGADLADDEVARSLRLEMREDFQSGRVASLHGWRISRTEARVLSAAAQLLA